MRLRLETINLVSEFRVVFVLNIVFFYGNQEREHKNLEAGLGVHQDGMHRLELGMTDK